MAEARTATSLAWVVPGWLCVAAMALTIPRLAIVAVISLLFCDAPGSEAQCGAQIARAGGAMLVLTAVAAACGYFLALRRFGWLARIAAVAGVALCAGLWRTMELAAFG